MASIFCKYRDTEYITNQYYNVVLSGGTTTVNGIPYTYGVSDIKVNGNSIGLKNRYSVSSSDEVEFVLKTPISPPGLLNYCDDLLTVRFSDDVTTLISMSYRTSSSLVYGVHTIEHCPSLSSVELGSGLVIIDGGGVFLDCPSLVTIISKAAIAPELKSESTYDGNNWCFEGVGLNGTLLYPIGSDYSQWLSTEPYYLGYYGWNGIESDFEDPNEVIFELEYNELNVSKYETRATLDIISKNIVEILITYPYWAIPTEGDGYFIIDILENDGLPRSAEITFIGISTTGERVEQILKINQEGIEDMATSIALYKLRLDYPAEGGGQYVQVDYINASVINAPYCSQSWVTIEQTQQGTAIDGNNTIYQRQYKITMEPAAFARQINVKFSCTSESGIEVSTDKLMLYQAAPTENPDDGEGETGISAFSTKVKVKIDGEPEYSSGSNLGVGYENLTPAAPSVDVSWIHVGTGVKDTGTSTYDTVMRYPTTYDANEGPERTGTITWTGIDGYGNAYTSESVVTQYGTDTPVDEGMITLKTISMTLPAEGGSDVVVVEYYDTKTIYDPEFVGDWATITEVSSTSSAGTAFNGTECTVITKTYRITAEATDSGRQAKVIFRADINYYDGGVISMEKDKFRVYQLAPGASELTGIVYPFRNALSFDYKGIADTWDTIKVGYKDVTIETPEINVDWFRVKSTIDRTYSSKEYDYIYEYELDVDENDSVFAREGTITFIGENEDGTKTKGVVKVTQKGAETNVDEGEHTNYKGYFRNMDCELYSVSFITNPNYDSYGEITLAGDSPVVISYTDSKRLYDPIRTSTCTIRVISKHYLMNLYSGKAQGTQVIVKNEDTGEIKWCGYLQPNLYNQGYSNDIEEIEFEASDCLSTLQYFEYEDYYVNGRKAIPFKYIIDDIMDRCKLINSYYITKKQYIDSSSDTPKDILLNKFFIAEHNFFSEEDEPWTLQEVLEETCKFFGYTCYQWGDSIYFLDYDQFFDGKMLGYRYDKANGWYNGSYITISESPNYITAESYMGTGADMSLDDVFNKVSVNCNYYNVEDVIPDLFDDELLTNRMDTDGCFSISRYTGRGNSILSNKTYYRVYDHRNIDSIFYSPLSGTSIHEQRTTPSDKQMKSRDIIEDFVGGNIIDMIHLNYSEANGRPGETKDWQKYLLISQLNRPWCGAEGTFHWEDYNFPIMEFKNLPTIFVDNTTETSPRASRPSTRPGVKPKAQNYLVIDAEAAFVALFKDAYVDDGIVKGMKYVKNISCYRYMDNEEYTFDHVNTNPALCFYLEIPSKGWWNGTGWVDYKTHFEVPLEPLNTEDDFWGTSKSVENMVESNLFIGAAGYKIPLPVEMDSTGFMYFAIGMPKRTAHLSDSRGGDYTGNVGNAYCFIKNLSMKICNIYSTLWEDKDMLFENIIDADNVIEGDSIDLKITSDNGYGYSLSNVAVMTTDDKLITDFNFYNKDMSQQLKPEEAIIDKYVNQYSTPSIKENVTLDLSFLPHQIINDTWWEKHFIITGQEIDLKMCSQKISILEKK